MPLVSEALALLSVFCMMIVMRGLVSWAFEQDRSATMHFAPWDAAADSLEVHDEDAYYGALLKSWNFVPELKMHATDFKIVAFKPDGWNAKHWPIA